MNSYEYKVGEIMIFINGETYDNAELVPDFGTVQMIVNTQKGQRVFILKEEDLSKLNLLTSAKDGSYAKCYDSGKVYIKAMGVWTEDLTAEGGGGGSGITVSYDPIERALVFG
jgi:hypothetical protein